MNSKLMTVTRYGLGVLLVLVAFSAGYYKATLDCGRKSTGFSLSFNLALYDLVAANKSDQALSNLKVILWGESQSLHAMEDNPLNYFKYEVFEATAGDVSKRIIRADEITKDLYR